MTITPILTTFYYTNQNYHHLISDVFDQSKLPSLNIRRIRTMALETFNIVNKSSLEFIQNIITIKKILIMLDTKNTVDVPRPRTM